MDSFPSRAAGILVFGALSTPIIAVVWLYWGTGWGLVAWASALPLALIPWAVDEIRRALDRRARLRRRLAPAAYAVAAQAQPNRRRLRPGRTPDRSWAEARRRDQTSFPAETG